MNSMVADVTVEPHTPIDAGDHPLWNESQYLWWYDDRAGLAGFHRVAHLPNDGAGKAQVWNVILAHDGRRFRRCAEVGLRPDWRAGGAYRAEDLEIRHRDGAVEITSDSPECTCELRFTDFHPPAAPMGHSGTARELVAAGHVEAGGGVTGMVVLDGERIEVHGLGFRDHSWGGKRDMRPARSTRWANGTTGPGFSFCAGYMTTSGFSDMRFGWILRDGAVALVPDFDLVVDYERDGVCWRTASLTMKPADGAALEIEFGPTFDGVVLQSQEWMPYETATRITVDGVPGVGNVESAANPRGGLEIPRTVGNACTREGLSRRGGTNGSVES